MKILSWHCSEYQTKVIALSNCGVGEIVTDEKREEFLSFNNVAVFFCSIENGDEKINLNIVEKEIIDIANDWGIKNILIVPFAHLSNQLAPMKTGREILNELTRQLKEKNIFTVEREHFGSDKELFIHLAGHKTNVRFREFKSKNKIK